MIKIEKYGKYELPKYYELATGFEFKDEILEEDEIETYSEISLYDFEKDLDENLKTGVKYLLLPIRNNGLGEIENKFFLLPGNKVISKFENLFTHDDRNMIVSDYLTMFGLRLNRFKNYNSDFFKCDERVLFESLIMKFEYFRFKPFYLSFKTIYRELGIRKDRAVTIINKFKKLDFLESEIVNNCINGQPTQITYYNLKTEVIIDLIPEIYLEEETSYEIKHDIIKYLKFNKK